VNDSADLTHQQLVRRIDRARVLARERAATADLLTFYADLTEFQQSVLRESPRVVASAPAAPFGEALNARAAATLMPGLLAWLAGRPQQGLAGVSEAVRDKSTQEWAQLLEAYWRCGGALLAKVDEVEQFVVESVLLPLAEHAARSRRDATSGANDAVDDIEKPIGSRCPICQGHPIVATLVERGHGARRSLVCGFCLTEWPTPRVVCPFCGEDDFTALLVYRAEEFPDIRIDACAKCTAYVKTIDLTVSGAAVHVVDDLASLALDLWAAGRGYRKIRPNLLRL
jgi:formate dehydrogenase accessory protein FdhE